MCELKQGAAYVLPVGVKVTAELAAGGQWRLTGPGGWGRWVVRPDGRIFTLPAYPTRRKDKTYPTGWTVADLSEAA